MPMEAGDIKTMISDALPDAEVEIEDFAGDGDYYRAKKSSPPPLRAKKPASSSTKWSMMRSRAIWAACSTHWPCRQARLWSEITRADGGFWDIFVFRGNKTISGFIGY